MQNFSNSPTPHTLASGFGMRSGGGPPYPPQPAEPQLSPRMAEDYAALQQQSLLRGHPHSNQASSMLAYNARNRGIVESPTQGNIHSSSNNHYRKDAMDYYFSLGAKDKNRRGGLVYGTGFAYPNIDGHIPPQYRHSGAGSVLSSGIMSQYSVDYGPSSGSGGASAAFPPHQYTMSQNAAMQSMPASQSRQPGQTYSPVHHGQQHRSYPSSGHRMTPQYPQYSPQPGVSSGSSGMYSPPPQRYVDGTANTGFDPKVNSSHSVNSSANSVSGSAAANNMGPVESLQQRYHAANYSGYIPQTQMLHKESTLQHCNTQHNLGVGYDNPVKMQHQGPTQTTIYGKHQQTSTPSIPHTTSQEIAKSPTHPQQSQINQNLSPISNPSPAASAVHSPSCSSTPSPLMGVSEPYVHPSGPSHSSSTVHSSSHSHRLIQAVSQLSPTPNSNSSISSCGSNASHKGHSISNIGVNSVPPPSGNKAGPSSGLVPHEDGLSSYSSSSFGKMQDAGLSSLNALSSQVANLPNTIHHMVRTDSAFSQKKGKDGGQVQPTTHSVPPLEPRSRNAIPLSSTGTVKDKTVVGLSESGGLETVADEDSSYMSAETKTEQEDHLIEGHQGMRQMSGASNVSEPNLYNHLQSQNDPQSGQTLNANTFTYKSPPKEILSKANAASNLTSPASGCFSSEVVPDSHSKPPVSSPASCIIPPPQSNCVSQPSLLNNNSRAGLKKSVEIKNEQIKTEHEEGAENVEKDNSDMLRDGDIDRKHGQDKENVLHTASPAHNQSEQKATSEEQLSVGVIVSARSEGSQVEKSKQPQDFCLKEKQSQSYLKESTSHNGEGSIDLSRYSSQHPKINLEQTHNLHQFGSHKYGFVGSTYGSDASMGKKGRTAPSSVNESSSRNYQQSHPAYASEYSKDLSSLTEAFGKRGQVIGTKGQEDINQIHQFPSLLQEVLQGYNLDRRYGRPEQAFPAHLQLQQQFQTRYPYGMTEHMRMVDGASSGTLGQMATTGKPRHPNNRHGSKTNFATGPQPSTKLEASSTQINQNIAKKEVAYSEDHLTQGSDVQAIQPKQINLADYSLPQRKTSTSSAVQELLLQEPEPLKGCTGQADSQKSERRSVICDVSPNRRSTPEKDRQINREREKNQSVASVIQQSFSSPASVNDLGKQEILDKKAVKIEMAAKEIAPNPDFHASGGSNESDMEYSSKSVQSSIVLNSDPYRHLLPHSLSINPLSSPSRHQPHLHGIDLGTSNSNSFPGYRFGDTRDSNMPRGHPHFPAHHPYHSLSPQPQTTNKLQIYPHHRGSFQHSNEITDWVKTMNRPTKDVTMMPSSSPGRHKVGLSEHIQRMIPQTDLHSDQHATKSLLHQQGGFYEMKMWEPPHPSREGVRMLEGDSAYRTQAPPPPLSVSQGTLPHHKAHGSNTTEHEEAKRPCLPPSFNATKPQTDMTSTQPRVQRQTKPGGPGETNPLMLRRRVRSFISPIPAKRLLQDPSQQRVVTNSHPPVVPSESNHHNDDETTSSDVLQLTSPLPGDNVFPKSLSPSSGNIKALPSKKGRGLKLEAIVQKISPSVTKSAVNVDDGTSQYPGFSNATVSQFSDSQDQEINHYSRSTAGDDGFEDVHSLNDMMPFRSVDETGSMPLSAYPCDPQTGRQKDFDFGLGASVVSASGEKEEFALLGPLPPPPPIPRPVQGSPPPSSSALSDIQHFTNTYQQLETRRGEQSAANLLRQKIQESDMGFDDYTGNDYYRATSHQMCSPRPNLSGRDCKTPESGVPKGYFPSGKKKGRPVGSVNKQKRAQGQVQLPIQSQPQDQGMIPNPAQLPPIPITACVTIPDPIETTSAETPILENKSTPPLTPPILTQVVKMDVDSEPTEPEIDVKPVRRRRKGLNDEDESPERRGRQRIRRGGAPAPARDNPEIQLGTKGANSTNRAFLNPKGLFVPHIHVENKIPEIGSVCSIVNAEDDKLKGERGAIGGKTGGSVIDSSASSTLFSHFSKRESEMREMDQAESSLQSGKTLPSSGYVVSGPTLTETKHSGRQLCCLCKKWANYKHLGDLYGPFYPAEYAAKLPKNQPQVRQCHTTTAATKTAATSEIGLNALDALLNLQKHVLLSRPMAMSSNCTVSLDSNLKSLSTAAKTPFLAYRENMIGETSTIASSYTTNKSLSWEMNPDIRPIPDLKREIDFDSEQQQQVPTQQQGQPADESQQRPQHRKLTSHPRFKRRHKSSEKTPRMVPSNSKASLPFQPPPPALDSLGPLAQLAQLPQMPMDPEELWVHEGCIVWTSGVYLVNGRLYGLQEALDGARETSCSYCDMVGSTLGCYSKGCIRRYHYHCAIETDCSLNEDNFSLRCPKHKLTQNVRPAKSMYLEQSERG